MAQVAMFPALFTPPPEHTECQELLAKCEHCGRVYCVNCPNDANYWDRYCSVECEDQHGTK